jgi:phosphohistidine phosphatase
MNLYIMQHGPCLPQEINAEQPLSPLGRDQMSTTAKAMRIMGLWFDVALCSPRAATTQTTQLIAEGMGYSANCITTLPALEHAHSIKACIEALHSFERYQAIFLCGHLPLLGDVASHLLSTGPRLGLALENNALLCLSVPNLSTRGGSLRWLLQFPQLQMIATS